jgi:hypothetical protein
MNDFDDRIRHGLDAGLDAPPAAPPFADVERRARRLTRRRRAVVGGALLGTVAVVAGVVAAQQPADEDSHTVVVTQPESSTTTAPEPTTSTTSTSAPEATTTTEPAGPPGEIVTYDPATRELVVVETTTGGVVEVLDTLPEGSQLSSLDVSTDGSILYTSVDSASDGVVRRVRRGGTPEVGPTGTAAAAGPDGRVVVAEETFLTIYDDFDASIGTVIFDGRSSNGYRSPRSVDWSADGRWISGAVHDGLLVIDTTLEPAHRTLTAGGDRLWQPVTFDAVGNLVVFEHTSCAVLGDQTIDPSCVEEPPGLFVIDPGSGDFLDTVDPLTTDELASDLDVDPSGEWLAVTLSTYESTTDRVHWFGIGGSGIVPGPFSGFAAWAPPATAG